MVAERVNELHRKRRHRGITRHWLVLVIALATLVALTWQPEVAYAQDLYWESYDVTIDLHQDGTFTVTEEQVINFSQGTYSEGFAVIPLGRVEQITNVQVSANGTPYDRATSGGEPGTYTVQVYGGELEILWWFPTVLAPETRQFTISYDVIGGLRVYPETNTNQLWWRALDEDFAGDVRNATITVNLPAEVPPEDLTTGVETSGFDGDEVSIEQIDGDTVRFQMSGFEQGDALEVRLAFPPITTAEVPAWQPAEDERIEREEALEPYKALANLLFLGAGILLVVGSPIGVYLLWRNYGRDVPVEMPADILREPPDDLPPGAVGTLIDEQAEVHDMIATLVDLAERGVIQIEEENSEILGFSYSKDWIIRRTGSTEGLPKPESNLLSALLGRKDEVKLKDVRERFGKRQGEIKTAMYEELVRRGYFPHNPEKIRRAWKVAAFVVIGIAVFLGFTLMGSIGSFAPFFLAVIIGIGVAGVALLIGSRAMPRRTEKGAEAAKRWVAFRNYLAEIERYQDLEQAQEIFSNYLPYAIAFGIEKSWVRKFARIDTPAPHWYGPYPYPRGPRRGWSRPGPVVIGGGGSSGGGDIDLPGMPSLQDISGGFAGSLQSMSDGLFDMFDEASDVFKPYSSSGSGGGFGGGFGGGGGGFGGGGGGGGRGFR